MIIHRTTRRAVGLLRAATLVLALGPALASVLAGGPPAAPEPPRAKIEPHELEAHGQVRIDDYYWLRERDNPEVRAYLEAENAYLEEVMTHTAALQESLFVEIKDRIRKDDSSVPYLYDGYYYYDRYEEENEYPIYCRKRGTLDAPEEILLDVNELAAGHSYFAIWAREPSAEGDIYAFAADTLGRRIFDIYFKNLRTGELLPDVVPRVTSNIAWAEDNRTLFYTRQDSVTLRHHQIYRHELGSDPADDILVYEEADETFDCYVFKSKSRELLMIVSTQTLSDEYRFLDARDPTGEWRIVQPRQRELEYSATHLGEFFYIRTNWEAENFRLMRAPITAPGREHWEEVIPHRPDVLLQGFELFRDYLVLNERVAGLPRLRVISWSGDVDYSIPFDEPTYDAYIGTNAELDLPYLRYGYTSMITPWSVYDYDLGKRERTLRKQDEVLGGYDPGAYRSERLQAEARDGTQVPISIVYPRDMPRDGSTPLLLAGYGSYGWSWDAGFSASRLSLLERGFAYAIAHIRGGQELGRRWYEEGKLLKKKNTFTDFIDCARYLITSGYTSRERIFAEGNSAGGLLIGAVANMAPDLFHGLIAEVPFVDVMTTMLDASIPLTTGEYDEWGNPNEREYYDYMLSYSPYDNVAARDYPHMLVTAGLHDSQVQYWEPAKWVARLRARKTDDHRLLLHTNMEAGHGGTSGRFRRYREIALTYAFVLDLGVIT